MLNTLRGDSILIFKGFKFGMILQLAIGPICLFVLNTALSQGFLQAQMAVLGTVVTDGTEIILAILGLGIILNNSLTTKKLIKVFGVCILLIFGLSSILSSFDIAILPLINIPIIGNNPFIQAILLALSNPLTIVFWAGIFSAKITQENMKGNDLYFFALGCVLATLFFLTVVAWLGSMFSTSIPEIIIKLTNGLVGVLMLCFAYKNAKIDIK